MPTVTRADRSRRPDTKQHNGLAHPDGAGKLRRMPDDETDWLATLRAPDNAAAVAGLRGILLDGLRHVLRGRPEVGAAQLEDFTQDATMRVLDCLGQFQGRSRFTTWAHSIAINTAFAQLRRKHWRDLSFEAFMEGGNELAGRLAAADTEPGADEERRHLVQVLRRAIAERLTERQRAIINAELDGTPFDQTVSLLNTNRNAAYKLAHDARRALKEALVAAGVSAEQVRTAFSP